MDQTNEYPEDYLNTKRKLWQKRRKQQYIAIQLIITQSIAQQSIERYA